MVSFQVVLSIASSNSQTNLDDNKFLLRCANVSEERDTGEQLLAIVKISDEEIYIVMAIALAEMVVAANESKILYLLR